MRALALVVPPLVLAACSGGGRDSFTYYPGDLPPVEPPGQPPSDAAVAVPEGSTATNAANVSLPAPVVAECVRVDEGQGASPSLHAVAGRWFAFFTEGSGSVAPLNVRSAAIPGLAFGPASTLLYGATKVDLVDDGGLLRALASRQFYAVFLDSADGATWTEGSKLPTSEVDLLCDGFTPAIFARGSGPPAFVAAGRDYNTHIFGCAPEVLVAAMPAGNATASPVAIGKGYPVLALRSSTGLDTVAGTFGVYTSRDQGATFTEVPSGDTTADQIRGTSGAMANATMALAQSYSYGVANPNHIAVIFSDDGGSSWPRRVVLQKSGTYPGDPLIAADGDFLAVAWQTGGDIQIMTSPDRGATWSEPAVATPPSDAGAAQLGGLAVSGTVVAIAATGGGVQICRIE